MTVLHAVLGWTAGRFGVLPPLCRMYCIPFYRCLLLPSIILLREPAKEFRVCPQAAAAVVRTCVYSSFSFCTDVWRVLYRYLAYFGKVLPDIFGAGIWPILLLTP